MRAELLIVGNEILSGKVADAHASFLCREFRDLGVEVCRIIVLPDEVDAIADAVRSAWDRADVIVTTGGIGPTHDDVTVEGVAMGLGRPLVNHPDLARLLHDVYGVANDRYVNRMSMVPEGAVLVSAEDIAAPVLSVGKVYVLPGVPEILRRAFLAIRSRFRNPPFYMRTIYLRVGEEVIAPWLFEAARGFPSVALGSYPVLGNPTYRVQVTLESKDESALGRAFEFLMARWPQGSVAAIDQRPSPAEQAT